MSSPSARPRSRAWCRRAAVADSGKAVRCPMPGPGGLDRGRRRPGGQGRRDAGGGRGHEDGERAARRARRRGEADPRPAGRQPRGRCGDPGIRLSDGNRVGRSGARRIAHGRDRQSWPRCRASKRSTCRARPRNRHVNSPRCHATMLAQWNSLATILLRLRPHRAEAVRARRCRRLSRELPVAIPAGGAGHGAGERRSVPAGADRDRAGPGTRCTSGGCAMPAAPTGSAIALTILYALAIVLLLLVMLAIDAPGQPTGPDDDAVRRRLGQIFLLLLPDRHDPRRSEPRACSATSCSA